MDALFSGIIGAQTWGAKAKYFQGAEEIIFRELGRSMHYFQGSREHRPPGGGGGGLKETPLIFKHQVVLLRNFLVCSYRFKSMQSCPPSLHW